MTVATSLNYLEDNRTDWSSGRLSFFNNINDKSNDCNNKCAKKEKRFPRNVHCYHLPHTRKVKKISTSSRMKRKQPPPSALTDLN